MVSAEFFGVLPIMCQSSCTPRNQLCALPAIIYFEVQAQEAPVGTAVLAFVVRQKFQKLFAMNRAEVEGALADATAPVAMVHIGECRGMGLVCENIHGTRIDEAGVVWVNCCPCCSTPPQCTTCQHVFDIMREKMVAELERRRQAEEDSQDSQGPSDQKRPAE